MQLSRRLRSEWRRYAAMGLTVLLAVTAFVVLTGSAQTSQLRTTATVNANFRSSYDILVRPPGSKTALESRTGRVRPNYLSGIFGGITRQQVAEIKGINGVEVAAPIAMLGEVLQTVTYPVDVTSLIRRQGSTVLRFRTTEHTMRGLASVPGPAGYVYVGQSVMRDFSADDLAVVERIGGRDVPVCHNLGPTDVSSPFDPLSDWSAQCWDRYGGLAGEGLWPQGTGTFVVQVRFSLPVMIAAVDPKAEAALTGLGDAMVAGRYLTSADGPSKPNEYGDVTVPVLASSVSLVDQTSTVHVDRLGHPAVSALRSGLSFASGRRTIQSLPGNTVLTRRITAQQVHQAWLEGSASISGGAVHPRLLFTTSASHYEQADDGALAPKVVPNDPSVWQTFVYGNEPFAAVPETASDTSYRTISPITATGADSQGDLNAVDMTTVGTFDPTKIRSVSALSKVPLETYRPPSLMPADTDTRDLLGGKSLLPDTNPAGYLQSPPLMLTTLASLPAFTNPKAFQFPAGSQTPLAPISVVRVRVADVTGADAVSRERVRLVAEQIKKLTGLDVDITVGSSPHLTTISLPASAHGAPPLRLTEPWVQKGVAAALITAIDRKSLTLFVLILLTSALAVAVSATAAVRSRRTELGVLTCIGWRPWTLIRSVLAELLAVGLAAGVLGAALSAPLGAALGVSVSWGRASSAIPAALALILVAGILPAARASRAVPADAVRPAVSTRMRSSRLRGVVTMASSYLRRTPGRVAAAALALALAVAALTILLGIVFGFHGAVVGTLLGDAVSVQVRAVDLVAGVLLAVLGLGCLIDVLYLDIREQAPRYASLQAAGWRDRTLGALIVWQAVITAVLGAVAGAALGLAALNSLAPLTPRIWLVTIVLIPSATAAASIVALMPAYSLRKLPTARLLAQE